MLRRSLIAIFCVGSFVRAAIFAGCLLGVTPWSWVSRLNLMMAPQAMVFIDPLFYNQIYICLQSTERNLHCTTVIDFAREHVPGPFVIGERPFSTAAFDVLRFRDTPLQAIGETKLRNVLCHDRTSGFFISEKPMPVQDLNAGEGIYFISCDS